jgi:hypothetical protein
VALFSIPVSQPPTPSADNGSFAEAAMPNQPQQLKLTLNRGPPPTKAPKKKKEKVAKPPQKAQELGMTDQDLVICRSVLKKLVCLVVLFGLKSLQVPRRGSEGLIGSIFAIPHL